MDTDMHAHPSRRTMMLVYVGSIAVPFVVALAAYVSRMAIDPPEPRVNSSQTVPSAAALAAAKPPTARNSPIQNP